MTDGASLLGLAIGGGLAAAVGIFANGVGYDRGRAFYPTVLTVVGALYVLFATIAGAGVAIVPEIAGFALFAGLAAWGFRTSLWLVVAGLALHGGFDFVRHAVAPAPGAPMWWPAFCGAYDVVAAAALGLILVKRRGRVEEPPFQSIC